MLRQGAPPGRVVHAVEFYDFSQNSLLFLLIHPDDPTEWARLRSSGLTSGQGEADHWSENSTDSPERPKA